MLRDWPAGAATPGQLPTCRVSNARKRAVTSRDAGIWLFYLTQARDISSRKVCRQSTAQAGVPGSRSGLAGLLDRRLSATVTTRAPTRQRCPVSALTRRSHHSTIFANISKDI